MKTFSNEIYKHKALQFKKRMIFTKVHLLFTGYETVCKLCRHFEE